MREILFRGKMVGGHDWAYGCYYKQTAFYGDPVEVHNIITSQEDLKYDMAMEYTSVVPETVGQFTGLTDKNGNKIFDGDIIEWDEIEWGCPHRELVEWDYSQFSIRRDDWNEWCEVIGNIHDNPELLQR